MAQLEIRDRQNTRSLVDLGPEPIPLGFDADGEAAWGAGRVLRKVAEVEGDTLRADGKERKLKPDEPVALAGLELIYRSTAGAALRAAALNEVDLLWTVESVDDLLARVLDALVRVLGIERAAVVLFDDDEKLAPRATRGDGIHLNPAVMRAALDAGAALLTSESAADEVHEDGFRVDVRSILCAPLRDRGVLYADNHGRRKTFTNDELYFVTELAHLAAFALANLTQTERLREENTLLKKRLEGSLVHAAGAMEEVVRKVEKVAGFDATVLITGESGVGKEVVAREIHARSPRKDAPFVAVNCAAIPETLLESELFGYAPHSAISGADPKGRAGKFEQADQGTIFLDEIGELKQELQAKLLRVLQDKKVDRLHDTVSRDVDVRILCATNQRLEDAVKQGRFREDLYYRLNVVALDVPPLRRRRDDIPVLTELFIRTYPGPDQLRQVKVSKAALRALKAYGWPGNVRELKNCVEQALILGDGKAIRLADLPDTVRTASKTAVEEDLPPLTDIERDHIARVLRATKWNKAKSARILGISKPTLYDKIRNYELRQE